MRKYFTSVVEKIAICKIDKDLGHALVILQSLFFTNVKYIVFEWRTFVRFFRQARKTIAVFRYFDGRFRVAPFRNRNV